ncbi:acyltransferase family protein [Mucilaginibacter sp. RS28]|uniref:Acyltransferase family protein n=1 Tax=Mucilaginibacter straminoryzae TaxID=2932774 RepID=A0A9X1X5N5_9SPHI|nr:acyltransferase family protein [Mucilaginibacter straminoryzae]MCJ8211011.1 acyltransferase family protein [Mucilaginibacter straminoryzae]
MSTIVTNRAAKQLEWIDNIKIFAVLAVIGIHVAAYGVALEFGDGTHPTTAWWVSNFYESLFRSSVPLFVMITGALVLPKELPLNIFLKKRLGRILLPFLFWSLIYLVFNYLIQVRKAGFTTHQLLEWLKIKLLQGTEFHLWYVYMIIGLYMVIPVIQPWINSASNKKTLYFLGIWIIALALKQFGISDHTALDIRYFSGYLGYLVLGYYLAHRVNIITKHITPAALLLLTGFIITFQGTYLVSAAARRFSDSLYDFLSLNVLLMAVGIFTIIKGISTIGNSKIMSGFRNIAGRYGFSIYLSHPLFLNIMNHFNLNYKFIYPAIAIPAVMLICLLLSITLGWVFNKIPFGKYVSG